jgi:hypothetical protein
MDQILGILVHVVAEVVSKATGRNILNIVGLDDSSEQAMKTVGGAFWLAVIVAVVMGIRTLL